MGSLKFRLPADDPSGRSIELKKAFVTGVDRTPERINVEARDGHLICRRDNPESGRFSIPWRVAGFGAPIIATATLADRATTYDLAVELARGKLNDIRNQAADWSLMGLKLGSDLETALDDARRAFALAATSVSDPEICFEHAQTSLAASFRAGKLLTDGYSQQVLHRRLDAGSKLPTLLSCGLDGDPKASSWSRTLLLCTNAGRIRCGWGDLEPVEGQFRWDVSDAQLHWCRRKHLAAEAGPILEFHPSALPDWIWLFEGDFETITRMVESLTRQVVGRYKGKIATWHLVARPASSEMLGLSEDEQIRLTARVVQVARQVDPDAQMVVDLDRPWAEWMGNSPFQLGPLHLADSLARADLGLTGIGLEIAPGFSAPGSHLRDTFEFSRLLDLYSLLNLPLHVTLAFPSGASLDPKATKGVKVETSQWPGLIDDASQRAWGSEWIALAAAKPFVKSVTWLQATDSARHLYPNSGLFRADDTPKPLLNWMKSFRSRFLN